MLKRTLLSDIPMAGLAGQRPSDRLHHQSAAMHSQGGECEADSQLLSLCLTSSALISSVILLSIHKCPLGSATRPSRFP